MGQGRPRGQERMNGLCGRGSPAVWHHGRPEYHRTIPWGLVRHSLRRGLHVYGLVGEGKADKTRQSNRKAKKAKKADKVARPHLG